MRLRVLELRLAAQPDPARHCCVLLRMPMQLVPPSSSSACCSYCLPPGSSARSAIEGQGAAAEAEAAARFALLCQCSPPTPTAIARLRSGLCCRLSTQTSFFSLFCTPVVQNCSRVLGFPNPTAPNKRLPHFRSLPPVTPYSPPSLQPCPPPP
jgi:hypothetical protein